MTDFPDAKLMVRSYDREHALELVHSGVDTQIRETFESAMLFGETGLLALGVPRCRGCGYRRRTAPPRRRTVRA